MRSLRHIAEMLGISDIELEKRLSFKETDESEEEDLLISRNF